MSQGSRSTDNAAVGEGIGAIEHQRSIVGDVATQTARRACGTDLKDATADGATTSVSAAPRQDGGAGTCLGQTAATADGAAVSQTVGSIKHQSRIVGNVARDGASDAAIANLQGASADGCAARKCIAAVKLGRAGATISQCARAANYAAVDISV